MAEDASWTGRAAGRALDVAIAGTRGVPGRYGGFETFAEELGAGLAARGHRVTVYGRVPYVGSTPFVHRGVRVVPVAGPGGKHLETPAHALATALVARGAGHDAVVLCNAVNAFVVPLLRAGGARVALAVDGADRLRRKWGLGGRLAYEVAERLGVRLPDVAVADARCVADEYLRRHGRRLPVITYGADHLDPARADPAHLARWGLAPGRYALAVGRLEPENNALLVVRAWCVHVRAPHPLVVVGDAPHADGYKAAVRQAADPRRVVLTGGVYGPAYLALQAFAACYVAAGEVGGTHPALIEAMHAGGPVVAHDVPEHREVLGDAGLYYGRDDAVGLAAAADRLLADPALAAALRARARARVDARYRWADVVAAWEVLLRGEGAGAVLGS